MRKRLIWITVIALVLLSLIVGLNTARNAVGWQPLTQSPAARSQMLAPAWRLVRPATPGPHKAAILLSGCDGVHDNMDYWAQVMRDQGRVAMILDSHEPRGLNIAQSWRAVCAAQILTGAERAGDLAIALHALRMMPGIDASDVAILGASHGGWTVMELMALLGGAAPPPGLDAWPAPQPSLARQIGPVIMLYPYCGILSGGALAHWPGRAHGLMILAQNDAITDPEQCREMAAVLAGHGADIDVVTLPGVNHGFDQQERSALSTLEFDAQARAKARALVIDALGPSPGRAFGL